MAIYQSNEHKPFLYPAVFTLMAVAIIPTIYGIWVSLHEIPQGGSGIMNFVGLSNYADLFSSSIFWQSVGITLIFVFFGVFLSLILGFCIALLLNNFIYGRQIILTLFILPIVVTPVVSGLVWKFMFDSDIGIINFILGLLGVGKITWLSNPITALSAIIIVETWQWTPFCMFFILAGLQNIPISLYEAGLIDGANRIQIFSYIIFPQLIPVTAVVILLRIMDSFKAFDTIFVMTQGGPGRATQVLNMHAYYIGFRYFNLGEAAAIGIIVLFIIITISQILLKTFKTT